MTNASVIITQVPVGLKAFWRFRSALLLIKLYQRNELIEAYIMSSMR